MKIYETATLITDLLLAALAAWLAWRLRTKTSAENRAARWMAHTLAFTAASGVIGGTSHGFGPNFSEAIADAWWRVTLLTINLLSAAMAMSLVCELASPSKRTAWRIAVGVKFLAFATAAMLHPKFVVAIADYGSTLIAWLVAALVVRRAWLNAMLTGIGLSVIAAMVQQFHWAPAAWFNHNDLYHVIQAAALVEFYRAGQKLGR